MATPSETSIANAALTLLGERRINSLDESSKSAKILKERFDEVRDEVLRSYPWNFATVRAQIAADAVAPSWGFDYAYTLPSDCLRLLEIENLSKYPYRIEGRKIITDHGSPLNVEYTSRVTDPQQMDVMFRQAFAAALGADVAEAITGTTAKVEELHAIRDAKMKASKTPDGQEHSPRQIQASEWLDSREEVGFVRRTPTGSGTPL